MSDDCDRANTDDDFCLTHKRDLAECANEALRAENATLRTENTAKARRIAELEAALADDLARDAVVKALEAGADDFKRDLASGNFISEDRHEAMALTEKALRSSPPTPRKSEDEIRAEDFITKTLELLDEGHDTDETGVCFRRCGGCKREEELREMAKSLRSSPPNPRKSDTPHGHDEGGCTHCDEYDNSIRAEVWKEVIEFSLQECRSLAGRSPSDIVGNPYKTARYDANAAILKLAREKAESLRSGKARGGK